VSSALITVMEWLALLASLGRLRPPSSSCPA
jgi:hypothetical protein